MDKKIIGIGVFSLFLTLFSGGALPMATQPLWTSHITNFTGEMPATAEGYKTLSYPVKVMSGGKEKGFYYSQYVFFSKGQNNKVGAYYMGIQPWGGNKAKVIFSVFGSGVEKQDASCTSDADGNDGSSCFEFMPFEYDVEYKFIATLVSSSASGNIWEGYAINMANNDVRRIGSWKTPSSWGLLSGKSIGFIEYFVGVKNCSYIPDATALFGPGVGSISTTESVTGVLNKAYSAIADPCKGKIPFTSTLQPDGRLLVVQDKGMN